MRKLLVSAAVVASTLVFLPRQASSHCEIPCGIYGDVMRISMLYENITTIEKSMNSIIEIGKQDAPNWNQLVRWVRNKEEHANNIQHIVTQYFLTQRIKADNPKYVAHLKSLHGMLVGAMKAKQTTDLDHVKKLRDLVAGFSKAYFSAADLKHIEEHHPEGK